MAFRNHQDMDRSLGIDVFECQDLIILMHNFRRNAAFDNAAKNTDYSRDAPSGVGRIPDFPKRFPSS